MGAVYEEFERELAEWNERYAGRPRDLVRHLLLLAIEREQIVTVAYQEDVMIRRLAALAMPPRVRDLVRHALVWAWKDEEMHAIWCRGSAMALGGPFVRLVCHLQQWGGHLGGWIAAVQHHVRWGDAPLSRFWAGVFAYAARLAGKLPREVAKSLRYGSFRSFCAFNVDAEMTAARSFERLVELCETRPGILAPVQVDEIRRMQDDEERHTRVFSLFASMLDDDDRLRPGFDAERVAAGVAEAGEYFLPPRERPTPEGKEPTPLGRGGRVVVRGGPPRGDESVKRALVREALDDAGLDALLAERIERTGRPREALRVAVKVSFMLGYSRRDPSSIGDPVVIDEVCRALATRGLRDVAVLEGPNQYDAFYGRRSVREVAAYFGIAPSGARLVDVSEEQVPEVYARGLAQHTIARSWRDADLRISLGKMRSHPVELVYLTLGNLEGLGARADTFVFSERQAHRDTALCMLLDAAPPHLAVLDACDHAADGLLGIMACRRPRYPKRIYASRDALALDVVAAHHMGLTDPLEATQLRGAIHWFGDPRDAIHVDGIDEAIRGWRGPYSSELSTVLSFFAYPVYQYVSGRGALFVPEMDERAFPPVRPEGALLRAARRALRVLVGLRGPRRGARP